MSRKKVDLSLIDTEKILHMLYVRVVKKSEDFKSYDVTMQLLKFLQSKKMLLSEMGIKLKIFSITTEKLQNAKLKMAMRQSKITNLPALKTPEGVYLGFKSIVQVYQTNIVAYTASKRQGKDDVKGISSEDEYDEYMRQEMTFERAEEDSSETAIGEENDMMDQYRHQMQAREAAKERAKSKTQKTKTAPKPAKSSRPDNVGSHSTHPGSRPQSTSQPGQSHQTKPQESEGEDSIEHIISSMQEVDTEEVFAGGGDGDSTADDTGAVDPQDRFMESRFWSNQESSM